MLVSDLANFFVFPDLLCLVCKLVCNASQSQSNHQEVHALEVSHPWDSSLEHCPEGFNCAGYHEVSDVNATMWLFKCYASSRQETSKQVSVVEWDLAPESKRCLMIEQENEQHKGCQEGH